MIPGLVATLAAGLFAGAAVYITFVEHPARMSCGTAVAIVQFRPSYRRATVMQASLAVVGAVAGAAQWVAGGGLAWLAGGLTLGAVVPYTLLVILPTNEHLLDDSLDQRAPEAKALLVRWGRLHAVRSALGSAAFVVELVLLAER
jgi:hypothetical protein